MYFPSPFEVSIKDQFVWITILMKRICDAAILRVSMTSLSQTSLDPDRIKFKLNFVDYGPSGFENE